MQNQYQAKTRAQLLSFQERINEMAGEQLSLTAYVRMAFLTIERGLKDGTPMAAIFAAFNEHFGLNGTLAAFKSALHRIRKDFVARRHLGIPFDADLSLFWGGAGMPGNGQHQYAPGQHPPAGMPSGTAPSAAGMPYPYQRPEVLDLGPRPHVSQQGGNGVAPEQPPSSGLYSLDPESISRQMAARKRAGF